MIELETPILPATVTLPVTASEATLAVPVVIKFPAVMLPVVDTTLEPNAAKKLDTSEFE